MAFLPPSCAIRSNKILDARRVATVTAVAPLTLEDAKTYLRMTGIDDDNVVIQNLIDEAVDWIQEYCGISLVESDVTTTIEIHNRQELPYGPVKTITAVDGLTLSETEGFITAYGYGRFTQTYVAGYEVVPPALKGALLSYVAYTYEHRGDDLDETDTKFAAKAKSKAFPYIQNFGY